MECLVNLSINTETGNSKYSPNALCSTTFKSHFLEGREGEQMGWGDKKKLL
jgi:hypothetical protein